MACVASVIGILALPFWVVLGGGWARRYFEHLSCTLTDRALVVKKGVWFRSESTVPLDRIQDVAIRHGPLLDRLGLATIRVDTASAVASGQGSISLTGVVDTVAFRDRVLEARDRAAGYLDEGDAEAESLPTEAPDGGARPGGGRRPPSTRAGGAPGPETDDHAAAVPAGTAALLTEIRDSLGRIEGLLASDRR